MASNIVPIETQTPINEWVRDNTPYWANKSIEAWDQNKLDLLQPFVKSHYWSDRESINVFAVVGTAHPDYIGLTWHEFLHQGKRMKNNQRLLESNPIYYEETHVKQPSMLYVSIDGSHWYVNGDGNHRTCLARFQFERLNAHGMSSKTMIHGVTVDDYRIDWELHQLYTSLQKILEISPRLGRLSVERKSVSRDDTAGWKIDYYQTQLKFINKKGEHILDKEAAIVLLDKLNGKSASVLSKWFSK